MKRRVVLACFALAAGVSAASCVHDGYPLGSGATVVMDVEVGNLTLYAADLLGPDQQPVGARQVPYSTGITLHIVEEQEAAFGGFVDITVTPPDLLTLSSSPDDGDAPTCAVMDGFFRCTANHEGLAKLVATSEADKSGKATITAKWASDKESHVDIDVRPAGLPAGSGEIRINNLHAGDTIRAQIRAITCYEQGIPDDIDTEWREGHIRATETPLSLQATPPLDAPGAIENAPIRVRTDDATAALSLNPACGEADRTTELRLQLDALGKSAPFYACFSDLGGDAAFEARTGDSVQPLVHVEVEAEPRILRIENQKTQVEMQQTTGVEQQVPVPVFFLSAYGVHEEPVKLRVRLDLNDHVLQLTDQTVELPLNGQDILAAPVAIGTAQLGVTPFEFPQPTCKSKQVTVVTQQ